MISRGSLRILSYTTLLSNQLPDGDRTKEDIAVVHGAAQRAAALVKQLLAFSREQLSQPRTLDVNAQLANLEKLLRAIVGERFATRLRLDPTAGNVFIDPIEIEQIIMNLVLNARDAMPEGGQISIETRTMKIEEEQSDHFDAKPGRYVLLTVSDNGCGMDSETRAKIFDPFFTTKSFGTGLGLATVHALVEKNGGRIMVQSEPNKGTTFRIYLPRHSGPATGFSGQYKLGAKSQRGSETILLVEDDELVRKVAVAILRRSGFSVLEASDGGQALAISRKHPGEIHLLLTDVIMPKAGGHELAAELANQRPDIKVVYMSGYSNDEALRRAVVEQGAPFVQKPFTLDSLVAKIRDVLDTPKE